MKRVVGKLSKQGQGQGFHLVPELQVNQQLLLMVWMEVIQQKLTGLHWELQSQVKITQILIVFQKRQNKRAHA